MRPYCRPMIAQPEPAGLLSALSTRPRLGAALTLLDAIPHLAAFWPGAETVAIGASGPPCAFEWVPDGGVAVTPAPPLVFSQGPFQAQIFGRRHAPVMLFAAPGAARDPLAALLRGALAAPAAADARQRATGLRARIAEARIGGVPGLPDPGAMALGCGAGEAILVVDPCDPARTVATRQAWQTATSRAQGRPLRAVRSPAAPAEARATLAATLPERLAPWTLLDAAAELHTVGDGLGLLGLMAGVAVHCHAPASYAPWAEGGQRDGLDLLAVLAGAARCADPFRREACGFEAALALLGEWHHAESANRRIAVCVGMSFWKRRRIAAAFASTRGEPEFHRGTRAALSAATRRGGAIAVWASRAPRDLAARAAEAGIPLVWVEDGFIRSAGLGAGFLPGASLMVDRHGPYYDPAVETALERSLATATFPPALLARAARLVASLRDRQVTKYNLTGPPPDLPARDGRRRILVPGQVADDLSVLRGATGAVRDDRSLLAAARAAEPDAFLIYKPHPDVVAGYRRGGIPAAEARELADLALTDAPMAALLDSVDGLHTLTSLAGFEALLRGLPVTVWGQPFYAGWGLTEDRVPLPRRRRRLSMVELAAGALILHSRYIDPVTELPCPPETLLDRLAQPDAWRAGPLMQARHWQGRAAAALGWIGGGGRGRA